MESVASTVKLSDAESPYLSSRLVLAKWSKLVQKNVRERKLGDISKCSGEVNYISSTLNQMAVVLGTLQADVRELKEEKGDLATTFASQVAENAQLRQENAALHEDYSKLRDHGLRSDHQLKTLKSALSSCSSPSPAPVRKRPRVEVTRKRPRDLFPGNGTDNDDDDVHSVLSSAARQFPTQRFQTGTTTTSSTSLSPARRCSHLESWW